ncbi:hypothetical protein G9C98_008044 [Cotesia typhae]|uniref:Uncharacterized protein n=1 Tax=Cotesia typhae TaxID=2053667 RepID=A0A8J5V707_9HYME|nr:hypothetical protein G9C98_008044 [Cotesia typhae]
MRIANSTYSLVVLVGSAIFSTVTLATNENSDTLSLNDGMEKLERHPGQGRPRQQMIDHSIGIKTKPEPTFDFNQPTNVTALIGKTAYLTCRVRHLGNKTPSSSSGSDCRRVYRLENLLVLMSSLLDYVRNRADVVRFYELKS